MLAEHRDLPPRARAHRVAVGCLICLLAVILTGFASPVRADIYDRNGNIIPGTEGINVGSFVVLSGFDLTDATLNFANLFSGQLNSATLTGVNFTGANLISANLQGSTFNNATLTSDPAIFTSAQIASANFSFDLSQGFTRSMFESTKSFVSQDLIGVNLSFNDMSGWNFSGQNLARGLLGPGTFNTFNTGEGTFDLTDFTQANLAGVSMPSSLLGNSTLALATFIGANAASVDFSSTDLSNATMELANLSYATLSSATLTGVNLSDAIVASANFSSTTGNHGFTKSMFQTTKSFKDNDIRGINLSSNALMGWDFSNQNAASASFSSATLSNGTLGGATFDGANLTFANFSNAILSTNGTGNFASFNNATVNYANFSSTVARGFTKGQLSSTASYQNFDLTGINLSSNNLTVSGSTNGGWDFSGQNVSSANFSNATLTSVIGANTFSVNFNGATVNFANFSSTTAKGFTLAQLQSTASYQNLDLHGINLSSNDLTSAGGWDFSDRDVSSVNFSNSTLSVLAGTANFSNATIAFANFSGTTARGFTPAMLTQTASYLNLNLRGVNFSSNNLSTLSPITWDFTNQDLTGASFTSSNVSTTSFAAATLALASFNNATLTGANFNAATLTSANLSGARLFLVNFSNADLTGVNFNGATFSSGSTSSDGPNLIHAIIKGATLSFATSRGFIDQMLYQTDSYQVTHDLTGANFANDDLTGWNFGDDTHQLDLSSVSFAAATLSNAQFGNATIAFANFSLASPTFGFNQTQLQQTNSFVNHDLRGINLSSDDLRGWDFSNQNLASANFSHGTLSNGTNSLAVFDGANIVGANFSNTTAFGFTESQLDATQSYIDGNLTTINFSNNNFAPLNAAGNPLPAWNFQGQNLSGATFDFSVLSNIDPSTGTWANSVNFTGAVIKNASFNSTVEYGFTFAMLSSTQSYADHNLGAIGLGSNNLTGWDFSGQNLNNANFAVATLDSVNFTGAKITGANFSQATRFGFTRDQLYSTYSYSNHSLGSINLSQNNMGPETIAGPITLPGWDFSNQYMPKANFSMSLLTQANFNDADLQDATFTNAGLIQTTFDRADLRGATGFTGVQLSTNNTILPDGTIQGLDLTSTYPLSQRHLTIRDYNGATSIPVHITKQLSLDSTSTLQIRLHDGTWGSTVSFDPAITVQLAGVLDLGIDNQALSDPTLLTDIYNYPGHARPIQLFNWNSSPQSPHFDSIVEDPRFSWDTTDLYDGGTILVNGLYGDLNRDGRVDVADLFIMAQHYNQPVSLWANGDLNGDGEVDVKDLQLLVNNWGFGVYDTTSPTGSNPPPALGPLLLSLGLPAVTAVPEPVMGCPLMMLAAMTFLRRSRRSRR